MTIESIARLTIEMEPAAHGAPVEVRCAGAWIVHALTRLERQVDALAWPEGELVFDGSAMSALDTSGAWLLHRTLRALEKRRSACSIIETRASWPLAGG